jgi:hypothetical protein
MICSSTEALAPKVLSERVASSLGPAVNNPGRRSTTSAVQFIDVFMNSRDLGVFAESSRVSDFVKKVRPVEWVYGFEKIT